MIGIVVTYHGEVDLLPIALDSIVHQTVAPQAVVVVNDAHPLGVLDLVEGYGFQYVRNARNLGLAGARNVGVSCLRTPYYLPLDADDRLCLQCIETYQRFIEQHGDQHYYYSDLFLDQGGNLSHWKSKPFDISALLRYNYISATSCVPKQLWEEAGGYDDAFSALGGWEDWAFWLSLYRHGIAGIHVAQPLFYRRVRADSMIRKINRVQKAALLTLLARKFGDIYAQEISPDTAERSGQCQT